LVDPEKKPIYSPLSKEEAELLVSTNATIFPDKARVWIPNVPYKKIRTGLEPAKKLKATSGLPKETSKEEYESYQDRSQRRARMSIRNIVDANEFDMFATFTFDKHRNDIEKCRKKMSNWLRNQRKRNGRFKYLIVPEFHKSKDAIHFHALISGYKGQIEERLINPKTGRNFREPKYGFKSYTLGFSDVKFLTGNLDTKTKLAWYLQKYISKDMGDLGGKNRYWASRNLHKPFQIDNPELWYYLQDPDRFKKYDHGTMMEFDYGSNPIIDMIIEAHRP